jgi:putative transposase
MPRLRHYDDFGLARFITFSCYRRHPYLDDERCIQALLGQLKALRSDHGIRILGYVIMPDHVHLVLHPPEGRRLGLLIGQMKGRVSHTITAIGPVILSRANGQPAVWQRRCYDYNCRTPEIVKEKIVYCHNNPVQRGLVAAPDDWLWSSCGWYQGDRNAPLEIDGIEL